MAERQDKNWKYLGQIVLNCVRETDKTLSFSDISSRTGLDRHTVSRVADKLKEEGKVEVERFATAKIIRTKGGRDG